MVAPQLCQPQLVLPDRVSLSCCSPIVSASACCSPSYSCCSACFLAPVASASAAALTSHPLHLLLPDYVRLQTQPFWKFPVLAIARGFLCNLHRVRGSAVVVNYKVTVVSPAPDPLTSSTHRHTLIKILKY